LEALGIEHLVRRTCLTFLGGGDLGEADLLDSSVVLACWTSPVCQKF
jgi:hypothetical protein